MLYFSDIKNSKVCTEDGVYVGLLQDVVFQAHERPQITKLSLRTESKQTQLVPIEYVRSLEGPIVMRKNYETAQLEQDELFVRVNLLDNQIIDISGDKMVRVNDVAIQDKKKMYIAGVDTSLLGILRWFRVEDVFLKVMLAAGVRYTPQLLSWADIQTIELSRGRVKVKTEQTKLHKIKAEDLADYLEQTNIDNIRRVLDTLTLERAGEVLNNLNLNYQIELFKSEDIKKSAHFMSHMESEEAADVLVALPKKRRERIITLLNKDAKDEITYLLNLSHTPIGDLLSIEYLTVDSSMTAREVLRHIKQTARDFNTLIYIYVLNTNKQLVGVFSLRSLIMQSPNMPVYKFMQPQVELSYLTTPISVVWKKLLKYKLYGLPVVDKDRHMLGLLKLDDVSEMVLGQL